jgi:hypothetical protein
MADNNRDGFDDITGLPVGRGAAQPMRGDSLWKATLPGTVPATATTAASPLRAPEAGRQAYSDRYTAQANAQIATANDAALRAELGPLAYELYKADPRSMEVLRQQFYATPQKGTGGVSAIDYLKPTQQQVAKNRKLLQDYISGRRQFASNRATAMQQATADVAKAYAQTSGDIGARGEQLTGSIEDIYRNLADQTRAMLTGGQVSPVPGAEMAGAGLAAVGGELAEAPQYIPAASRTLADYLYNQYAAESASAEALSRAQAQYGAGRSLEYADAVNATLAEEQYQKEQEYAAALAEARLRTTESQRQAAASGTAAPTLQSYLINAIGGQEAVNFRLAGEEYKRQEQSNAAQFANALGGEIWKARGQTQQEGGYSGTILGQLASKYGSAAAFQREASTPGTPENNAFISYSKMNQPQ